MQPFPGVTAGQSGIRLSLSPTQAVAISFFDVSGRVVAPGVSFADSLAFDVPIGMTIAQILLSGPLSSEQAVWSVTSSPPAEQSP